MPAVIMIENSYSNEDVIERLIYYILNPLKTPNYYVYGHAVNLMNVNSVIDSFKLIQKVHGKTDGRKVRHLIISFADYEGITCDDAYGIQFAVVEYFRQLGHQVLSAVHVPANKDNRVHFHMAINTVNMYTGLKYSGTYAQYYGLMEYLKGLEIDGMKWELKRKYVDYIETEIDTD